MLIEEIICPSSLAVKARSIDWKSRIIHGSDEVKVVAAGPTRIEQQA